MYDKVNPEEHYLYYTGGDGMLFALLAMRLTVLFGKREPDVSITLHQHRRLLDGIPRYEQVFDKLTSRDAQFLSRSTSGCGSAEGPEDYIMELVGHAIRENARKVVASFTDLYTVPPLDGFSTDEMVFMVNMMMESGKVLSYAGEYSLTEEMLAACLLSDDVYELCFPKIRACVFAKNGVHDDAYNARKHVYEEMLCDTTMFAWKHAPESLRDKSHQDVMILAGKMRALSLTSGISKMLECLVDGVALEDLLA